MTSFEAFLLGLVQGFTEFLPVSSSGHLTILNEILGIQKDNLSFEVTVHAATVLSTIVVFRKEIWSLLTGFFSPKMNEQKNYIFKILVSMIPVLIIGLFFKHYVEDIFGSGLLIVGIMLIVTALLLSLSEIISHRETHKGGRPVSYKDAIIIGIAQAVAVLPGLSRSGTTISTGLMLGVKKSEVAQFSFLMVLIPIMGEAFLELVGGDMSGEASGIGVYALCIGFATAFVSGLMACKIMINLVKRLKLWGFAIYCLIVGSLCIIFNIMC